MENRWSPRFFKKLDLVIDYAPIGLLRATTLDISEHGMFINTGLIQLAPEEIIELTFNDFTSKQESRRQVSANVIHSNSIGAGIQFIDYSLDSILIPDSDLLRRAASF